MADEKLIRCHYEVVGDVLGVAINVNGGGQDVSGRAGSTRALNGVEFPHKGEDASLWLIRNQVAKQVAVRKNGRAAIVDRRNLPIFFHERNGVTVHADFVGLVPGDGFVIVAANARIAPGPIDRSAGYPRPTVYMYVVPVQSSTIIPTLPADYDYSQGA